MKKESNSLALMAFGLAFSALALSALPQEREVCVTPPGEEVTIIVEESSVTHDGSIIYSGRKVDDYEEPADPVTSVPWRFFDEFHESTRGNEVAMWSFPADVQGGDYELTFSTSVQVSSNWGGYGAVYQVERNKWNDGLGGYLMVNMNGRCIFKSDLDQPDRGDDAATNCRVDITPGAVHEVTLVINNHGTVAKWDGVEIAYLPNGPMTLSPSDILRIHVGSEAAPKDQPRAKEGSTEGWKWSDGSLSLKAIQ